MDCVETMDTTDGVAIPIAELENNNVRSPDDCNKQKDIYLENNIPVTSSQPTTTSLFAKDSRRMSKTKTLDETIETLKLNALPLCNTNGDGSRLTFSKHTSVIRNPTENTENLGCSLISTDIICNCDGTVYLSPNDLSSKLLTPDGLLNELSDGLCSPFPVLAKSVKYCLEGANSRSVLSYAVTNSPSIDPQFTHLAACLICRLKYQLTEQLISHGVSVHSLSSNLQPNCNNSSAVIQQVHNQGPSLSLLKFEEQVSVEALIGQNVETPVSGSSRVSSTSSPPTSANKLSSNQRIGSIGCDEHPEGGIECPKCELVLGSTRSLGGHMTMMHSRNSCKTLKCPKCNWHYKYQETLEIHMKEKHPETEQTCIYCVTKQSHPRLARGESYMCGYKPYRCDICNYSTTTKGNLSIHMQSDKHINNIQELQSSAVGSTNSPHPLKETVSTHTHSPSPSSVPNIASASSPIYATASAAVNSNNSRQSKQQKNTWRCDVCNYETNIARNLRIHMTSEKHTHNMVILQQNVKSMQRNMNLTLGSNAISSGPPDAATIQQLGTMFPFDPLGIVGQMEALSQQQGEAESSINVADDTISHKCGRSRDVYGCVICNAFTTDDLADLDEHISTDRSSTNNAEHVTITVENHYLCKLCDYKTPLKANFQLHCKTDKHVQRVQLINHIREGGTENEWRLRYLNMPNPVHIVCNVCAYQSNSIHKMRVHSMPLSHVIGCSLFMHLRRSDEMTAKYHYCCSVCSEVTTNKIAMVTHVRMSHASQIEQLFKDGWSKFTVRPGSPDLLLSAASADLTVKSKLELPSSQGGCVEKEYSCPQCSFTTDREFLLQSHISSKHSECVICALCSDRLTDVIALEQHLFSVHNVKEEGAKKLLAILDTSHWKSKSNESKIYRCQTCTRTFDDFEELCHHQSELGHLEMKQTPKGPGYLCWKKGCNQYFRSDTALLTHFKEIHSVNTDSKSAISNHQLNEVENTAHSRTLTSLEDVNGAKHKCAHCNHEFRSSETLQKHVQVTHTSGLSGLPSTKENASDGLSTVADLAEEMDGKSEGLVIDEKKSLPAQSDKISTELEFTNEMAKCSPKPPAMTSFDESSNHDETSTFPVRKLAKRSDNPFRCIVCDVAYAVSKDLDQHLISAEHLAACSTATASRGAEIPLTRTCASSETIVNDSLIGKDTAAATGAKLYSSNLSSSLPDTAKNGDDIRKSTLDCTRETKFMTSAGTAALSVDGGLGTSPSSHQMYTCQHCCSHFVSSNVLSHHQRLFCTAAHSSKHRNPRSHFKKLLKSFGQQQESQRETASDHSSDTEKCSSISEDEIDTELKDKTAAMLETLLPPEMNSGKLTCSECQQTFSGIWVLKAHKEEAHGQLLPEMVISHFAKLYKQELDEKLSNMDTPTKADAVCSQSDISRVATPPITAPPIHTVKSEPCAIPSTPSSSLHGLASNAMELLSYSAMNPWLNLLPFPMLNPGSMYNPMIPPQPISNMATKPQSTSSLSSPPLLMSPQMDSNNLVSRQHSVPAVNATQAGGEKRARTRISDDQLKVLRQYFDINNSPSEEAILDMAAKTGLPPKVIKHWFRNTLFKERQRNKDSPYNFNNPPQTTLNLAEYEKTGRVPEKSSIKSEVSEQMQVQQPVSAGLSLPGTPKDDVFLPTPSGSMSLPHSTSQFEASGRSMAASESREEGRVHTPNSRHDDKSMDGEATYPTSSYDVESDHDERDMMSPNSPQTSTSGGDTQATGGIFSKMFSGSPYKFHEYSNSSSTSKRANRTRFTDFQIKTLQDYFEQNAYPKDEELEQLSRLLQLPNRVIVVWFQNARQKARKVYENSPSTGAEATAVTQPTKSNYPCKKCGVVFVGYYELVKHQKRVCMKNNVVPLPFGNQECQSEQASQAMSRERSRSSADVAEPIVDITSKQANTSLAFQSPPTSLSVSAAESAAAAAATTSASDMSAMMAQLGNASNLSNLFMPFMPLPGVLGSSQPNFPMQNVMKDIYEQSFKKYLEGKMPGPVTKSEPSLLAPESTMTRPNGDKGDNNRDHSHHPASTQQKVMHTCDEKTTQQRFSAASSIGEEDGSMCGSDGGDDTESLNDSGRSRTISGSHSNSGRSSQSKRYRTNLTSMQIHVMKYVFRDYKTPTMAECEVLGGYIGLQKRVVQVWFQNARAKEKKNKLVISGEEDPLVTECLRCGVTYSPKYSIQEHIFSARHISQLRNAYNGKLTECDREAMKKQAESQRPNQSMRRVSHSAPRKSDSMSKLYSPASPGLLNAGRSNDYSSQLSRNLLSSLNPMTNMMSLPGGTDMLSSLMYPGLLQQMPSFLPSLLPGGFGTTDQTTAYSSLCNSLEYGTPLSLLQIPKAAINSIGSKLDDMDCSVAEYSQDCSTLDDLYRCLSDEDISAVKPSRTDVGYACRKCQFVFPRRESCVKHQLNTCFSDKKSSNDTILKIEQLQFSCACCKDCTATIKEFKSHCATELHKYRRTKLNNNNNDSEASSAKRLRIV